MANFGVIRWYLGSFVGALALIAGGVTIASVWSRVSDEPTAPPRQTASPLAVSMAGWPKLLGASGHSTSPETGLAVTWPDAGPPVVWQREVGAGYSSPVVTDEGLLLLHRVADRERLECLDLQSGEVRWVCEYATHYQCRVRYSSGPYSTPVIHEDRVYFQSAEGALRCLEMATGELVWKRELSREYAVPEAEWGVGHSPCLAGGRVLLNLGGTPEAGVVALDALTGTTLWTATDYRASYASPVAATIHGLEHLFVFNAEGCVSLDPRDGRERWLVKFGIGRRTGSANAVSPLVCDDLLLLTAGPGPGALCLRILPDGGFEEVWRERRALDSQFNNQILLDGHVYGFTSKWQGASQLVCLELKTGKPRWNWTSDLGRGSGLAVDGTLILLGEAGHLAAFEATPAGPKVRSSTTEPILAAPCYSAPALHRGLLYVRNERQLLCLSLRKSAP